MIGSGALIWYASNFGEMGGPSRFITEIQIWTRKVELVRVYLSYKED